MIYIAAAVAFVILILIIALQAARASAKAAHSELAVQKSVNAGVTAESDTLKKVETNLQEIREKHRVETIEEQSHTRRDAFESDWGGSVQSAAGDQAASGGVADASASGSSDCKSRRADLS